MAASVADEIEGGSVRGAVFDAGRTTDAFDASTREVLHTDGRIFTTGDGRVWGSGSGSDGMSIIGASAWSVGFTGGGGFGDRGRRHSRCVKCRRE